MNMTTSQELPAVLQDVTPGQEVRFAYTFRDGQAAVITGTARAMATAEDGSVWGLRVEISFATRDAAAKQPAVRKAIQRDVRHPVVAFNAARMSPDPLAGSITAPAPDVRDDGILLRFEVTGLPGMPGTPDADGWVLAVQKELGGRAFGFLVRRDVWGRIDPDATARAFEEHELVTFRARTDGQYRVLGWYGMHPVNGPAPLVIAGEFTGPGR